MAEFPENILTLLKDQLATIPGVTAVFLRALEPSDPNGSVGLTFEMWSPGEVEMGGYGDPTFGDYVINIEHMVKNAEREPGALEHRSVARAIRSMLYRDPDTQVRLRQLVHTGTGYTERLMKWSVEQRFADNQIGKAFYFISGTTATFQTETV